MFKYRFLLHSFLLLIIIQVLPGPLQAGADEVTRIILPAQSTFSETLAAREVRRYVYLRTGQLLPILNEGSRPIQWSIILLQEKGTLPLVFNCPTCSSKMSDLKSQQYWIKTLEQKQVRQLVIVGGDGPGLLYGTYRFLEHLGVRFYLHGDVIPDEQIRLQIPVLDETGTPLFPLRGIQPFHDFPEGPDWWNLEDYQAILSQLPKLRMNFFGLHTYPEGGPNAEPSTWIGLPRDIGEKSQVKFSYPSSYQNTLRGNWGYDATKTSDYVFGSSRLFERDEYGSEVMRGRIPEPRTLEDQNALFADSGELLHEAFHWARLHGIKTCLGTETALTIPKVLQERLKSLGMDPADSATIQELYTGIFRRISQTYELDYYWLWTPENWTWKGASQAEIQKTTQDLQAAWDALVAGQLPFKLATCGWVLGPQNDRSLFDKILPKEVPVSCINREVGMAPLDPAFGDVKGRSKWAIPWMEDDPALTQPQLWVGRMRRDAADALKFGCDGLMGIHWRTRVLGPAVSALAHAAWDQSPWQKTASDPANHSQGTGALGGRSYSQPERKIEGAVDPTIYQTMRAGMKGYRLAVPKGKFNLTLSFCELAFEDAGRRIFDVKVQGKTVLDGLDLAARVGANHAFDFLVKDLECVEGWLDIDFQPQVDIACVSAIVLEGQNYQQKINCGGPEYKDYATDLASASTDNPPVTDFYQDWALIQFGPEVAPAAAVIFGKIDSNLPRPAEWVGGPGSLRPDARAWSLVAKEYQFVNDLEALRLRVKGLGNQERFEYWLNQFRYLRAMGELNCLWAELNRALEKMKNEKEGTARVELAHSLALPIRINMVQKLKEVFRLQHSMVSNPGEMGMLANWNQHILPVLITKPGEEIAAILGTPLPEPARVSMEYAGPERIFLPTLRTSIKKGEVLLLKAIVLGKKSPRSVTVFWRSLGTGPFQSAEFHLEGRGVYKAAIPGGATDSEGFEYYVKAEGSEGEPLFFPVTAPALNQSVVVIP